MERACYSVQIIEELTGEKRAKQIKAMENDKDAMRSYKFRIYPSKAQEKEMCRHLWVSKELWNKLLGATVKKYDSEKKFPSKSEFQAMVKNSGLYSQTAQGIAHRLHRALRAKIRAKKEGRKWGFPRFKSFDRMKSLHYPQFGFELGEKLKVTPFGELSIVKHRRVAGTIKTLTIKHELSGKWFAVFCAEQEPGQPKINNGGKIGIDLGLITLATLSNGEKIKNPHHMKTHEERLAFFQRELSNKKKGSHKRKMAKIKVARLHERVANTRLDFLHKTANRLLSDYSLIAMEKLASREMAMQGHGKGINDAGWGTFANILTYKAENAGSKVVFVDPRNTSKECSDCGQLVEKTLWERQHDCPSCGLSIDRDVNAAIIILTRATAGAAGSNASGDGAMAPSVKEDAMRIEPMAQ